MDNANGFAGCAALSKIIDNRCGEYCDQKLKVDQVVIECNLFLNPQLPVDKVRQRSAFPPNYVHSLDSTHMMYTA